MGLFSYTDPSSGQTKTDKSAAANFGLGVFDTFLGLGGLIGNAISTRKTNQMNLRIAQMNNEFNERMMREQMAWTEDMWNKQNQYNTPGNQRARLEAAGFNPYMMMQGGNNTGVATSASGVGQASASGNPVMQPMDLDTSSISATIGRMQQFIFQQDMMREQVQNLRIENKYKDRLVLAELNESIERAKDTRSRRMMTDLQRDHFKDIRQDLAEQEKWKNRLNDINHRLLTIELADKKLDFEDKQMFKEILGTGPAFADFMGKVYDLALKEKQGKKIDKEIDKLVYDVLNAETDWLYNHGTLGGRIRSTNAENDDKEQYFNGNYGFGRPGQRRSWQEYSDSDRSASDSAREYYPHRGMVEEPVNGDVTKGYTGFVNAVERAINIFKGLL